MRVNILRMKNNDAIAQAYLYFQHGKLEAAHAIVQPLALLPSADFSLLHLAGTVAAGMQLHAQAIDWFGRALVLQPGDLPVSYKLGRSLYETDRHPEALSLYLQLIASGTQHADLYLAAALLLQEAGRNGEALQMLEHALRLAPRNADGWHRHAALLNTLRRPADALQSMQQAMALAPDQFTLRFDLALILYGLHRHEEALECVDQVLRQQPRFAEAWACRGAVLGRLRRYEESIEASENALGLRPDDPDFTVNLALTQLTLGRFDTAWALYEARWQGELADPYRHGTIPRWPGVSVAAGKTILLWAEQGLGDTIHFCRYAVQVAALGAHVVLEVHASLTALMRTLATVAGTDITVRTIGDALPPVDYQVPLMSVPLAFKTRMDGFFSPEAYLGADIEKQRRWVPLLSATDKAQTKPLRVGIVCSGNPGNHNDRRRSISLQTFDSLLALDGVEFYLLQPEVRQSDLGAMESAPSLHWPGHELLAFDDTAALITQLDLVIGVDTATVHLAGALGVPVWILLSHAADWRWFLDRDDSPWYASARLFRQTIAGDWSAVMQGVCSELSVLTAMHA